MKTAIRCRKCSQIFEVKGNDMDNICEPCYEKQMDSGPAGLVGALQDPVHKEIGVSRPAKSRKVDPKNLEAMRARMAVARAARAAKRTVAIGSSDVPHPDSEEIGTGMRVLDEPGFVDTQSEVAAEVGSDCDPPEE